jgi:hypothetical protein
MSISYLVRSPSAVIPHWTRAKILIELQREPKMLRIEGMLLGQVICSTCITLPVERGFKEVFEVKASIPANHEEFGHNYLVIGLPSTKIQPDLLQFKFISYQNRAGYTCYSLN